MAGTILNAMAWVASAPERVWTKTSAAVGRSYGTAAGTAAALLLAAGVIGTIAGTWWPWTIDFDESVNWPPLSLAIIAACFFITAVAVAVGPLNRTDPAGDNDQLYTRYLVGVGFFLSLCVILDVVAFIGLAKTNSLELLTYAGVDPKKLSESLDVQLQFSLFLALSGTLFYIANSLYKKRAGDEVFSTRVFWAGLWFRLGESILFTIVLFLLARWNAAVSDRPPTTNLFLPIYALMLGMFVKTGERLIFGVAERLFAAAMALVPTTSIAESNALPGKVESLTGTRNSDNVTLTWTAPATGDSPNAYLVTVLDAAGVKTIQQTAAKTIIVTDPLGTAPREFKVAAQNAAGLGPAALYVV